MSLAPPLARLARVRAYLVDMDGTLYVGPQALPGAVGFMEALRVEGRPRLVLTNNSSRDGRRYQTRLQDLGMPVDREEVLTSGDASAAWLAAHTGIRRPFVLGTEALRAACEAVGLRPTERAEGPDAVLLGYDLELTYARLADATLLVAAGLPYFGTHADKTCIDPEGLLPDAGALIAAVETVTGRRPEILGKPSRAMLDAGLAKLSDRSNLPITPDDVIMIGDQLDTDITLGRAHGVLCALVMTGETNEARLTQSPVKPDLVVPNVGALHALLAQAGALPPEMRS